MSHVDRTGRGPMSARGADVALLRWWKADAIRRRCGGLMDRRSGRSWDACSVPWAPELFSAPALQRVLDKYRRERLRSVPFFDGLMSGEIDALLESFSGVPEVHHPVRGRDQGRKRVPALRDRYDLLAGDTQRRRRAPQLPHHGS